MARTGNQTSITFTGTSFSASYISLGSFDITRAALDDTALSNSSYMSKVPDDLKDIGPMTCRFFYDETSEPPLLGNTSATAQTCTITYGTSETLSGTGFFTRMLSPEHVNGALREAEYEWQFDGKTGPVWTVST